MPADIYTVNRTKELIISFLTARGPSLPVHIARDVKTSPLFAAAFLSELYNEGKIKMSNLKVGSTSLYYLSGQEDQLERFLDHLNQREKEAFHILKNKKVLEDEKLEPVVRVALRAIKDFAIPFHLRNSNPPRIFWRYFLTSEDEAHTLLAPPAPAPVPAPVVEVKSPEPQIIVQEPAIVKEEKMVEHVKEPEVAPKPKKQPSKPKSAPKKIEISLPFSSSAPVEEIEESEFAKQVKTFLEKKDIELIELVFDKKKEVAAKVRLKTLLGHQNFFLVAKDKKRIKEDELIAALQQAHSQKMPAILLAPGELEKKAHSTLEEWNNLIKFEKLK